MAAHILIRASAGRPFLEPLEPFLVPLGLAHHPQVTTARQGIRQGGGWALHAEDNLVVIDDLHLNHAPPDAHERRDRLLTQHECVGMHDIPGGELPIAKVEGHALTQEQRPLGHIGTRFPPLRQARDERAGLGIQVQQGLQVGIILKLIWATDDPEAVALVEAGGGKDEALPLRLTGLHRSRHRREPHEQHQHQGDYQGHRGLHPCVLCHSALLHRKQCTLPLFLCPRRCCTMREARAPRPAPGTACLACERRHVTTWRGWPRAASLDCSAQTQRCRLASAVSLTGCAPV